MLLATDAMPSFGENITSIIYLIYIANPYNYMCLTGIRGHTLYMIAVSEDVEPLKSMPTHLRRATFDLIPDVE